MIPQFAVQSLHNFVKLWQSFSQVYLCIWTFLRILDVVLEQPYTPTAFESFLNIMKTPVGEQGSFFQIISLQ